MRLCSSCYQEIRPGDELAPFGLHGEVAHKVCPKRVDTMTRDDRQAFVYLWCVQAFGDNNVHPPQRALRFLEEAIELAQACLVPEEMAHKLINHIYKQPVGHTGQELGGVGLTLLALAQSLELSADKEEVREVLRVGQKPLEYYTERNENKDRLGFKVIP